MTDLAERLDPDFEPETNQSGNRPFADVVNARLDRRNFLRGGLGLAVSGFFAGPIVACAAPREAHAAMTGPRWALARYRYHPLIRSWCRRDTKPR